MGLRRSEKVGKRYQNPVPTTIGDLKTLLKILPLFLTNKEERTPKVPLGPFFTDPAAYALPPATGLRITWFGHSSTLVEIDGVRLLLDPVWDERASPAQWAGPRRFFPPTIPVEALLPVDAVLMSHDHYDHLGAGTVRRLAKSLPDLRWIAPLAVGKVLEGFGVAKDRITELDWTESTVVRSRASDAEVTITAIPTRHFSGRSAFNRFHTLWAGYVLKGARHNVLYGADSGFWDGFAAIGAAYGPFDLTMLEIGAYHPLWGGIHLGPEGAADAFAALGGTGLLMPIHWGLFDLALHAWRQPIETLTKLAAERGLPLWSPEPGQPADVVAGQEIRSGWWRKT